jgi:hypothetical protein
MDTQKQASMVWTEYSERDLAFIILGIVDFDTIDPMKVCFTRSELTTADYQAAVSHIQVLRRKCTTIDNKEIFNTAKFDEDKDKDYLFPLLRQVKMATFNFEGLSRAHSWHIARHGRDALFQQFQEFGRKFMDTTDYEFISVEAHNADRALHGLLMWVIEPEMHGLRKGLKRIEQKVDGTSEFQKLVELHMIHECRLRKMEAHENHDILHTLRHIIAAKNSIYQDMERALRNSPGEREIRDLLKKYEDFFHQQIKIFQNLRLEKRDLTTF